MDRRIHVAGFALVTCLAFAPAISFAVDKTAPLKLKLSSSAISAPLRSSRNPHRPAPFQQAQPSLSQRALQSLLLDADNANAAIGGERNERFRFQRRGDAGRDLAAGYNSVCDSVSRKVWDDPDGKRVRFDIAGKPGVAMEIPLR